MNIDPADPTLEYSGLRRPWHGHRWLRRAIIAIVASAASLGGGWWAWTGSPGEWLRFTYWYRRCNGYEIPASTVVYSMEPAKVAALNSLGPDHGSFYSDGSDAFYIPPDWMGLQTCYRPGSMWRLGVGFMHQRIRPDGVHRLVVVEIDAGGVGFGLASSTSISSAVKGGQNFMEVDLKADVLNLSAGQHLLHGIVSTAVLILPQLGKFTLFAGQPDPSDASRFTIGYSVDGQRGNIVGLLGNDDTVSLKVLDGPLVLFEANGYPHVPRPRAGR